jgi:hypothetical protein
MQCAFGTAVSSDCHSLRFVLWHPRLVSMAMAYWGKVVLVCIWGPCLKGLVVWLSCWDSSGDGILFTSCHMYDYISVFNPNGNDLSFTVSITPNQAPPTENKQRDVIWPAWLYTNAILDESSSLIMWPYVMIAFIYFSYQQLPTALVLAGLMLLLLICSKLLWWLVHRRALAVALMVLLRMFCTELQGTLGARVCPIHLLHSRHHHGRGGLIVAPTRCC